MQYHQMQNTYKVPMYLSLSLLSPPVCLSDGSRVVQMDDSFFTGYRKTALLPQEILVSIEIPYSKKVRTTTL